jgi:TonB family protein
LILTGFGINYAVRSNARAVKPAAQSTQSSLTIAATSPTAPPPASVAASAPANVSGAGTTKSAIHEAKAKPDTHSRSVESTEVEMNPARSGLSETTSEAAPEAPAIGQIAGSSSSGIAASIIAARTAAPELTPIQSQGVVEGKLIRKVLPHYPEMAKRAGVSGDVVLSATITTEGKLKNVRVVSGSPLLREEAMSAAKQWRYSPYLLGGKPVETETHITISFHR